MAEDEGFGIDVGGGCWKLSELDSEWCALFWSLKEGEDQGIDESIRMQCNRRDGRVQQRTGSSR